MTMMLCDQEAVQGVKHAAASADRPGDGNLDRALKKLLVSLGAASSSDRSVSRIMYITCLRQLALRSTYYLKMVAQPIRFLTCGLVRYSVYMLQTQCIT